MLFGIPQLLQLQLDSLRARVSSLRNLKFITTMRAILWCLITDKDVILGFGPQTINTKHVIVKPWVASFSKDEVLKVIPLWVRFLNLPLSWWGPKFPSRIASVLRTLICVNDCTTKLERISYARVLIEINVTIPLPKSK